MFGKFFSNIFGGGSPQRSNTSNPSGEVFYQQNGQTYYDAPWLQQPILQPTNNSSYNYPASQQSYMDAVGMPTPSPTPTNNRGNQGGNNNQITITGGTGPAPVQNTPAPAPPPPAAPAPVQSNAQSDLMAFLEAQEEARIAAEERAQAAAQERLRNELMGQASALTGMASGYGINDLTQINSALAQLYGLQGQAAGSGVDLGNVDSTISNLRGLLDQRKVEQARFDNFTRNFQSAVSDASNYGVNDLDAINAAMNKFKRYQSGAKSFNSDLDVDTSFLAPGSQMAMDQLQRTLDERNRQLGVVADTRAGLEDFIGNFGNAYSAVDYRNSDQIAALEAGLDPITKGVIDGIDVDFDFSDLQDQTAGFNDMLATLRQRRSDDLDDFSEDITGFGGSIGGIDIDSDDFNAAQVYGARDDYLKLQNELGAFGSGDRVNAFQQQLFDLDGQYTDISDALNERQEGIEDDARSFVEELLGGSYTSLNQLQGERARLNELRNRRNRFDAMQSDDELRQVERFIGENQMRLEEEDRMRRAQEQRDRMMGGSTVMTPAFARQFMNDAEYQAFLSSLEQAREDPFAAGQATSFARSLGLA